MRRKITTRGIVFYDGKLLCARLKNYRDGTEGQKDYWCIPGGGLKFGESILDGVEREMIEETGIKPQIGNLLYVQQYNDNGTDFIEFFFNITNPKDYLNIDLAKTTHGEIEIAQIDFVDPANTYILPEFLSTDKLQEIIRDSSPTRVVRR